VVTGSSIKRTEAETALPVTVINRAEIDKIGAITAADLLRRLPQSGNQSVSQQGNRGGQTPGGESIALRDLSANATLVLLNGRRLPNFPLSSDSASFVSLDSIPAAALDRVEVLKDGASSIYGSDAVAGVVNFITRKDYQGMEGVVRYGNAQRSNPREVAVSLAGGFGNLSTDRYNALFTLEHLDRTAVNATDRSYTASSDNRTRGGLDRRLFYSLPANAQSLTTGALLRSPACPADGVKGPLCYTDFALFNTIVPASQRTNLTGIFTAQISPDIQVFGELLAGQQNSKSTLSPDILVGSLPTLGTARGNPFGVNLVAFGLIPGAANRQEIVKSNSLRALLGARGTTGQFDWETALAQGRGKTDYAFSNQLITSATEAALLNGAVSPFGTVPNDPARIAALLGNNKRNSTVKTTELDGRVSTTLFQLPAGPVEGSAGASWRKESLDDLTDAAVSSFENGVDYGRRDGSRNTASVYIESLVPLLKGLELQASARYDRYSDFGNTTNPKLALRWKALPDLSFRASASTGFRAPSLSQIVQGTTKGFSNGVVDPRRCPVTASPTDCGGGSVNVEIGGNKDLKPEDSKSWSAGMVFQLGRQFELTLDRYNIDYRNQINTADADQILRNELIGTGSLVQRNPASAADVAAGIPGTIALIRTVPANLARSTVSGWDVELKARQGAGEYGNFVWSGAATYVEKLREQVEAAVPLVNVIGTYNKPRVRATSALDWSLSDWSARLGARHTGGYTDGAPSTLNNGQPIKVGGFTQFDAQLAWKAWPGGSVTLGITNLGDTRSPYSNATGSGNAPNGDLIGRAFYVTARHAFR
jgi:iron complex outermembrane recepter protein